ANVTGDGQHLPGQVRELCGRGLQVLQLAARDDDRSASFAERPGDRLADPAAPAGDESDLARQGDGHRHGRLSPSRYRASSSARYFSKITRRRVFRLTVNSPAATVNGRGRTRNFFTCSYPATSASRRAIRVFSISSTAGCRVSSSSVIESA